LAQGAKLENVGIKYHKIMPAQFLSKLKHLELVS